jgi:hypothetical protein
MDEQHNGFDHQAESGGPEIDDTSNPTDAAPDQNDKPRAPAGREMLIQLQQMIDTVSYQAAPVIREVAAKAAELAVVAGHKAGPLAYKAAEVTEQLGQKVAARSQSMADDLRRAREDDSTPPDSPSGGSGESSATPEGSTSEDSAPGT